MIRNIKISFGLLSVVIIGLAFEQPLQARSRQSQQATPANNGYQAPQKRGMSRGGKIALAAVLTGGVGAAIGGAAGGGGWAAGGLLIGAGTGGSIAALSTRKQKREQQRQVRQQQKQPHTTQQGSPSRYNESGDGYHGAPQQQPMGSQPQQQMIQQPAVAEQHVARPVKLIQMNKATI